MLSKLSTLARKKKPEAKRYDFAPEAAKGESPGFEEARSTGSDAPAKAAEEASEGGLEIDQVGDLRVIDPLGQGVLVNGVIGDFQHF